MLCSAAASIHHSDRFLQDLYGPRTAADTAAAAAAGSTSSASAAAAAGGVVISSGEVEQLGSWNSRITAARRTKTVRQKWQELLLSVSGEYVNFFILTCH
jgi:hypothetical protein